MKTKKYYRNIMPDFDETIQGSNCSTSYNLYTRELLGCYGSSFDDYEFKFIDTFNTKFLEDPNSNLCDYCIHLLFLNGTLKINRCDHLDYLKEFIHSLLKSCEICKQPKLKMFEFIRDESTVILFWKHKLYKIISNKNIMYDSLQGSICKDCKNNLEIEPYLSVECTLCNNKYQSIKCNERYHIGKNCATYFFKEDLLLYSLESSNLRIGLYEIKDSSVITNNIINEKSIICDNCLQQFITNEQIIRLKDSINYFNKNFSYWIFHEPHWNYEPPLFTEVEKSYISNKYLQEIEKCFHHTDEEMNQYKLNELEEDKQNFVEELMQDSSEYQFINLKEYCNKMFEYLYA